MPWQELSVVDQREEFVKLALNAPNRAEVCRRFGISRAKGYKWLKRYAEGGAAALADRSRRPHRSPERTDAATEAEVLRIRAENNNAWGGRKIARVMGNGGWAKVPRPSTITEILRRHGKLEEHSQEHPGAFIRFEKAAPNELWQMDFKGHFATAHERCHPLTVLDDHSRYALGIEACANEQDGTVRGRLSSIFRRYGLPFTMLMDNGSPWGDCGGQPLTVFTVWLMRLGVRVTHGKPYHPQTQGKDERFHRTLKAEVLQGNSFADLGACQRAFDRWRRKYNFERPHDALGLATPSTRYVPSPRSFPEQLPRLEYGPGDLVRKVDTNGVFSFKGHSWSFSKALRHQAIALRPTDADDIFSVHFAAQQLGTIDLRTVDQGWGVVDIHKRIPTTPQPQQHQQSI